MKRKKKNTHALYRLIMSLIVLALFIVLVLIYVIGKNNIKKAEQELIDYNFEEYLSKEIVESNYDEETKGELKLDDIKISILSTKFKDDNVEIKVKFDSDNESIYTQSINFGYYVFDNNYNFIDYYMNEYIEKNDIKSPITDHQNIIKYFYKEHEEKINEGIDNIIKKYYKYSSEHILHFDIDKDESKIYTINLNINKKITKDYSSLYLCFYNLTYNTLDENFDLSKDAILISNKEARIKIDKGE